MATQERNDQMVDLLLADLQGRNEPQKSLAYTMSLIMALPGLRGFWPMSAVDSSGNAFDQSGNGRTLTYNGNPTYNYAGLVPYIDLDGTGDYLSRATEAGLDILGTESYIANPGLTMGGWFQITSLPGSTFPAFMGKVSGASQRSYWLPYNSTTGEVLFVITNDGSTSVQVSGGNLSVGTWYFIAGRFEPSTELAIWINGTQSTNTTSIPASIFNSSSALEIGRNASSSAVVDGRASMCFLCASYLSDTIVSDIYQQSRVMFGV